MTQRWFAFGVHAQNIEGVGSFIAISCAVSFIESTGGLGFNSVRLRQRPPAWRPLRKVIKRQSKPRHIFPLPPVLYTETILDTEHGHTVFDSCNSKKFAPKNQYLG
jgi:hypothetical protein